MPEAIIKKSNKDIHKKTINTLIDKITIGSYKNSVSKEKY